MRTKVVTYWRHRWRSPMLEKCRTLVDKGSVPSPRFGIILLKFENVTYSRRVLEYYLRYSSSARVANYSDSTALLWSCWLMYLTGNVRFPEASAYFHEEEKEGIVKICQLALHKKFPRYATDGYEVLYPRPPVIYLSAAAKPNLGQFLCHQVVSIITLVTRNSASDDWANALTDYQPVALPFHFVLSLQPLTSLPGYASPFREPTTTSRTPLSTWHAWPLGFRDCWSDCLELVTWRTHRSTGGVVHSDSFKQFLKRIFFSFY